MRYKVNNLSDLFNEDEKIEFLKNRHFVVEDFDVWVSENEYHNKVSFRDVTIKVAHVNDIPEDLFENNQKHRVESKIGIDAVFNQEMKRKMLFE